MVENWRSSGVATADAMVSGFAPGSRADLDGGVIDAGQRGHGQRAISHNAEEQNRQRDQRGHHRTFDKDAREVHGPLAPAAVLSAATGMHVRAGEQPQLAVGNHGLAGRNSFFHDHLFSMVPPTVTVRGSTPLSGFHHVNQLTLLARLHRFGRHHGDVLHGVQSQRYVDELPRP